MVLSAFACGGDSGFWKTPADSGIILLFRVNGSIDQFRQSLTDVIHSTGDKSVDKPVYGCRSGAEFLALRVPVALRKRHG